MNAIDIESLTKQFDGFVAVNDITMSVKKGEFMGLLGPNGAGKSTMLKVITGMIGATSGTVTVNGHDIADHTGAMDQVGCVIETPECYPSFSPKEMLSYIGKLRGIGGTDLGSRIRDVLEELRMWEWRDKPVGTFSKGMKQRVAIAQALLPDPEILILDEPTSGLDPRGMKEVRDILKGLDNGERSLLMSTHMLTEVSDVCGSVTMIRKGNKIMSGNVRELIRNRAGDAILETSTKEPLTQDFMKEIQCIEGISRLEMVDGYTFSLCFSSESEDRDAIIDVIRSHGLGFMTMNQMGSDLETLYMSMTGEDKDDIK